MATRTIWLSSVLIWGLYAAALFLPAALDFPGWWALRLGWYWPGTLAELANVALVVGSIALIRRNVKVMVICGGIGVLSALSAPFIFGVYSQVQIGYFLWLACNVCMLVIAAWHIRRNLAPSALNAQISN